MIKIKNILAGALLSILLSGCGLYPKFEKSVELTTPDNLYSYIEATSDTLNLASIAWRELFTDAKLQSLIEQGLENNTDLNVARLNINQAEIALKSARLAYTPTLSLGVDATLKKVSGSSSTRSYGITASSAWEIDLFGRLKSAKEQSKAALEQSVAYRRAVQTQLISSIAINYYSLIMLDEQLSISQRTLEMWGENIRTMESLLRAGRVDNTSVLQSKASRLALESSMVSLNDQIKTLENNLSVLLKVVPQKIERTTDAQGMNMPQQLYVGVPMQLLSSRPDVQVSEYALMQAFYAVGVARASLYPSLNLAGSISYSDGSGIVTNPGDVIYNLVGSILQPIFNRRTLRAQLEITKLQQEQALLEFNQTVLDAGAEVNVALIDCQGARKRILFNVAQIENLQGALRSSEQLMVHGTASYLDVLIAQQSLLSAELSLSTSQYEEREGVINLYRALGGGAE